MSQSYKRASSYLSEGDILYLKDIQGQNVLIYNIAPGTDDYGRCAEILVVGEGEEEGVVVHVSGFLAGRLIEIRSKVDSGEAEYPMIACFRKIAIRNGKSCWTME